MFAIHSGRQAEWPSWAGAALVLLALAVTPATAQGVKPLTIKGVLMATDPLDKVRKQSFHKVHEVELKKEQLYLIELRSLDFDTCLRVEDPAGKLLTEMTGSALTTTTRAWGSCRAWPPNIA